MPDIEFNTHAAAERPPIGEVSARPFRHSTVPAWQNTEHFEDGKAPIKPYTTEYGTFMLTDDGQDRALAGYVHYRRTEARQPGYPTPHFIVWSGGPLSPASTWHNLEIGPRAIARKEDGNLEEPPHLTDNPTSILDYGHLTLIDPPNVGIGTTLPDQAHDHYYGAERMAAANRAIVESCIERFDTDGPVILACSSASVFWVTGAALQLAQKGIPVGGIAIISGLYDYESVNYSPENIDAFVSMLPSLIVTAQYHGKMSGPEKHLHPQELYRNAVDFAENTYRPALTILDQLSTDEYSELKEKLAAYTGIDPPKNLLIDPLTFRQTLLADKGKMPASIDMRITLPLDNTTVAIERLIDKWGPLYREAMRHEADRYPYVQHDYAGNVFALPEWDFTDMWADRSVVKAMVELIKLCPDIKITAFTSLYDAITTPRQTDAVWEKIRQLSGIAVRHVSGSGSRLAYSQQPGVDIISLEAGHSAGADMLARHKLVVALGAIAQPSSL